jgi:transcriptional regulator with XRE-family HTH domain
MGRRLRNLREKRGWSQTYLSVHLGMDRSYLSDLERGKREACVRSLEVIAMGFEMSISQFMRGV